MLSVHVEVLPHLDRTVHAIKALGVKAGVVITIDLGQISIDALAASVDVPAATLTAKGSGAVGSLLCNLGNLLSGVTGTISSGVGGLVNALNNLI